MSLSKLLREATLQQIRGAQMYSKSVEAELRELRFLISNIGNNLNQLAFHSNRVKQVLDENAIFMELKKLDELIIEFTSKPPNSP